MMRTPSIGSLVLAGALVPAQALACTIGRQSWFLGQDVTYRMIVKPGESCGHTFSLGGGAEMFEKIAIVQRPRSGKAGMSGVSSVAYLAPASAGTDSFVVQVNGRSRGGGAAVSRFTFAVEIAP